MGRRNNRKAKKNVLVLTNLDRDTTEAQVHSEMCIYGLITAVQRNSDDVEQISFLVTYSNKCDVDRLIAKGMECDHGSFRPIINRL